MIRCIPSPAGLEGLRGALDAGPGRQVQTAWIVTEEHYNPTCYTTAGEHELTETSMGSQYVMIIMRTQVNMADTKDVAQAAALQDLLQIRQVDKGPAYVSSNKWDVA